MQNVNRKRIIFNIIMSDVTTMMVVRIFCMGDGVQLKGSKSVEVD